MKKSILWALGVALVLSILTLAACGGGRGGPDTVLCPNWNPGDSMTVLAEGVNIKNHGRKKWGDVMHTLQRVVI